MESFDYRLADLLDMSILQTLSDSNFQATGLPMTIIDAYDASILVRSGLTDICLKFHRANPASNQRCLESDGFVKEHLAEGRSYQYKCLNGLWNIAMPIMVAGRHLGTLFLSQFYFEGEVPEREFFIRQAGQFGYDLDSYLEALDRLPVFSLEKVNYILAYDQALVRFISDLATQSLRVQKAHEELEGRVKERTAELAEASESVKENLRLRQQILDTIPSPIFYKGIDGRYQGVNQAFLQFYGKTMEQVLGKTVYEVFCKEIADKYFQLNQHHWQHPGPQIYEYYTYDAQGQRREVVAHNATFMDKNGVLAGLAGIMIDVTDQKRAEEDRLRFSKLESLSTLAGGIAHDFNNILTVILGNIGLVMLDSKIEPPLQDRLAQAEQACLQAQGLSRQLLTFAKGGAPIKKIVSIGNLLKESATLTLSGSRSRYEVSIPDDLWSVEADTAQINQVIGNLLINADQAMPEGGIIKITAENVSVEAQSNLPLANGKYVKFAIADQGVGISPKYLNKIFDPYFSTKQKGSGLGLATAYSIIKNHSGHIQVESQLGVGATFHIYLPATEEGVPAAEPEPPKPAMGHGKVLVMDDEEMVREFLGRMLSRLGYEADFASDGSQAIEKFVQAHEADQAFDAVILDLTIPGGMGGKEAMQGLLKIDPQVKAIVSSGYSDDPIMSDFQKYRVSDVIAKPYRVAELSKILQRVIPEKRI